MRDCARDGAALAYGDGEADAGDNPGGTDNVVVVGERAAADAVESRFERSETRRPSNDFRFDNVVALAASVVVVESGDDR